MIVLWEVTYIDSVNQADTSPTTAGYYPLVTFLSCAFSFFSGQVEDTAFSLSHPNQYYLESQKLLGGGKDTKRDVDTLQKSQENSATRGSSAARETAPNASEQLDEAMENLEMFFQDAWFLF